VTPTAAIGGVADHVRPEGEPGELSDDELEARVFAVPGGLHPPHRLARSSLMLLMLSPVSACAPFSALYAVFAVASQALLGRKIPGQLDTAALALVLLAGGFVWAHRPDSLLESAR
jgi:hypothetical protein